jgi:prolyl oligopeptidase
VATVSLQRPDLFGAVVPIVAVLDMLRFPLFGQGAGWQGDFGSPAVESEFRALLANSPVHNTRPGTRYPATLVLTGDHDVRVAPLHSYKFVAALQAAQAGEAPILLHVDTDSGHSGGNTMPQLVAEETRLYAFLSHQLGLGH